MGGCDLNLTIGAGVGWFYNGYVWMSITFGCEESERLGYYAMQLVRLIVLQQLMCVGVWLQIKCKNMKHNNGK